MYPVSEEFIQKIKSPTRTVLGKVQIDYTDPFIDQSIDMVVNENASVSYPNQTADTIQSPFNKILSLDGSCKPDGTYYPAPSEGTRQMGWWGKQLAGADGSFVEPYPTLTVTFFSRPITELKVVGDNKRGEYPVDFTIGLYSEGDLLYEEVVSDNTKIEWNKKLDEAVTQVTSMVLTVTKWSHPGRQVKILEFYTSVQEVYEGKDLLEIRLLEEREVDAGSLPVGSISANEIEIKLSNEDRRFDAGNKNSPLYETLKVNRRIKAWLGQEVTDLDKINIVRDLSGNGNHGQLMNFNYDENSGWVDGGLRFDGVDDYVQLPELALNPDNFTIQVDNKIRAFNGDKVMTENGDEWGRNLIPNSKKGNVLGYPTNPVWNMNKEWIRTSLPLNDCTEILENNFVDVLPDTTYTQSLYFRTDADVINFLFTFWARSAGHVRVPTKIYHLGDNLYRAVGTGKTKPNQVNMRVPDIIIVDITGGTFIEFAYAKLEKGSQATPWTPAPEDITETNIISHTTPFVENNTIHTLRFYNRALTDEEIMQNYQGNYTKDGLILYYDMKPIKKKEYVPLGTFWSGDWDVPEEDTYAYTRGRDRLDMMRKSTYSTSVVQVNKNLYELAEQILQDAGLNDNEYWIDDELKQFIIPYSYFEPQSHREALRKIAEACVGQVYCDREGVIRIEGPSYLESNNTVVDTLTPMDYFKKNNPIRWSQIANYVEVETQPLRPDAVKEVYKSNEPVSITSGQTKNITVYFNHTPCIDANITLSGTGTITNVTYYAWGADVTVYSNVAGTFTLTINARPMVVMNKEKVIRKDETSIVDNGLIKFTFPNNPLVQTADVAETIADKLIAYYKDPRRDIDIDAWGNPALLLGDKIKVTDDMEENEYFITKQELDYDGGFRARITGRRG